MVRFLLLYLFFLGFHTPFSSAFDDPGAPAKPITTATSAVRELIDLHKKELVQLYQSLHSAPELSLHETKTAERLAEELRRCGCEVHTRIGGHGVVGLFRNGSGPTVLIRADMDALPIQEKTGLPYASTKQVRDSDGRMVGIMHACGHDVNMTCLIGTARVLIALKNHWQGTLLFIGQPAEEIGVGAKSMIDAGLFRRFPKPDYAFALHCDGRYPHGHVNYRNGVMQANVDSIEITITGQRASTNRNPEPPDPVLIASQLILDLQTITSREKNPNDPVIITVGSIQGNGVDGVSAHRVKLQLTVRTLSDSSRAHVLEAIRRKTRAAGVSAQAVEPMVQIDPGWYTPALENDNALTARTVNLFRQVLGKEHVHERAMSLGGEDFSQFVRAGIPGCYYFLGCADPKKIETSQHGGPPLPLPHSDTFAPVAEPTIKTGVLTMCLAVLNISQKK